MSVGEKLVGVGAIIMAPTVGRPMLTARTT